MSVTALDRRSRYVFALLEISVRSRRLVSAMGLSLLAEVAAASGAVGTDILAPHLSVGRTYSNVFSILRAIKADGYDELARRNGGSADYTVTAAGADTWTLHTSYRYDGRPGATDDIELREGGRVQCSKSDSTTEKCDPYLDGSGLIFNPGLWGEIPRKLVAGMKWEADVPRAWELGGANGKQQVTVISVDATTGTAVLMREGSAEGFFGEGEPTQRQLTRDGTTETLDVVPGTAHWKGYTTVVRGLIFSDELLVTREDSLHSKTGSNVHATERWIMLLNAAPPPTL
jgi:hypothetical protein